jgi:CBS-domain-containing membrane protein
MKKFLRRALTVGICLGLALLSAALTHSSDVPLQAAPSATALLLQSTTTPQAQDMSEIGSTDGIVAMVGIIVLILIVPILLRRKHWM